MKNSWHYSLVAATSIGIGAVAIYSLINSDAGNRPVANFTFPEKIPLQSGKLLKTEAINFDEFNAEKNQDLIPDIILSADRYQYQEQGIPSDVDVDMYYLNHTRGHINNLLIEKTKIDSEVVEDREIEQQGNSYYSLFQDSDRTYLSSCINPTGESTVDHFQFSRNLNSRQFNLGFLGKWLVGKDSIRDRRCLWVTISAPNNSSSFLESRSILEGVWQDLYQWWQPRFPEL